MKTEYQLLEHFIMADHDRTYSPTLKASEDGFGE